MFRRIIGHMTPYVSPPPTATFRVTYPDGQFKGQRPMTRIEVKFAELDQPKSQVARLQQRQA
jgi:hypothetical protein